MADVNVNNVQPSEVGPEMVAYLLAVSIAAGQNYSKSYAPVSGIPIILGSDETTILETYARCLKVVRSPHKVSEIIAGTF